ncbi:MAG: hypothetical protein P4L84_07325 [Isosphaeraceae bacterium]|nr:hypothetical protein [Isosphaeraceae bacterium]
MPEAGEHTSIKQRVEQVAAQGRGEDVTAAEQGCVAAVARSSGLEESHWLCTIEDRRRVDSAHEGMIAGFTLGSYLLLVDYTGRLFRQGKATMSRDLSGVFARLGSSAESWQARLLKLNEGRLLGRFFAATRERLRDAAARLGVHHLANLAGCPVH